jgi:hypothetical protein
MDGNPATWPQPFRQRVRLLQRMLGLGFLLAGVVLVFLGLGPLVRRGLGWLTALGAFLVIAGGQAILLGPYYLAWLEQHRRAPN